MTSRPHIVLMVVDDLGWGSVGYHASSSPSVQTPTIDTLARQGCILDRLYAAPRCSPSRAALLTGRHPWRHASWLTNTPEGRPDGVDLRYTFLSEHLRTAGYATALCGKWRALPPLNSRPRAIG